MIWNPSEIRKELADQSKKYGLRMPQMQTLLSQERFLARLYQLDDGQKYIWKGGSLVLRLYQNLEIPRFTVDIDLLAQGIDFAKTEDVLKQAMQVELDDGFKFLDLSRTEMLRETPYGGSRFEITWELFNKKQSESLKIDICAGDDVDASKIISSEVFLLPKEDLSLFIYPKEFVFAEKLETADRFYTGNTRLKDFVDLWSFIQEPMDSKKLKQAIDRCFTRRESEFNLERLDSLLTNTDFIDLMEIAKNKHFSKLKLPSVQQMFFELNNFIQKQ